MFNFFKKNRPPRIAFRETRDGTRYYRVEVWSTYDGLDYYYAQESKEVTSLEEAQELLKEITNKETVNHGVIN